MVLHTADQTSTDRNSSENNCSLSWAWWHVTVILALGRWSQEDHSKFKARLVIMWAQGKPEPSSEIWPQKRPKNNSKNQLLLYWMCAVQTLLSLFFRQYNWGIVAWHFCCIGDYKAGREHLKYTGGVHICKYDLILYKKLEHPQILVPPEIREAICSDTGTGVSLPASLLAGAL